MDDAERIKRLEMVVTTLISYLHRELGSQAVHQLLDVMSAKTWPEPPTKGQPE